MLALKKLHHFLPYLDFDSGCTVCRKVRGSVWTRQFKCWAAWATWGWVRPCHHHWSFFSPWLTGWLGVQHKVAYWSVFMALGATDRKTCKTCFAQQGSCVVIFIECFLWPVSQRQIFVYVCAYTYASLLIDCVCVWCVFLCIMGSKL